RNRREAQLRFCLGVAYERKGELEGEGVVPSRGRGPGAPIAVAGTLGDEPVLPGAGLRKLGDEAAAERVSAQFTEALSWLPDPRFARFFAAFSERGLLDVAAARIAFYQGLTTLLRGDKNAARQHFRGALEHANHYWARAHVEGITDELYAALR
ncbi:MAG: hypothetical protein VCB99_10230, partial [Myxococcota bacterium]